MIENDQKLSEMLLAEIGWGSRVPRTLAQRLPQFSIGTGSYGNIKVKTFRDDDNLEIGNYCSFADEVHILLSGEHRSDWVTTFPFSAIDENFHHFEGHPKTKGPVIIGHDVWVGYRATILSGVTIRSGAIVGAGSLVTRDMPPYGIVAGNPAKLIGFRFSEEVRKSLMEIEWWNWTESKVSGAMPLLLDTKVDEFVRQYCEGRS